jgi:dipeptidyl aminopeptidase/acylaminoacyl peptidase
MRRRIILAIGAVILIAGQVPAQKRPMTMMDVIQMKQITSRDLSKDGRMVVFALSSVDWKTGKAYSDIYVAPTSGDGMRRMTFTADKNETAPKWAPDGHWFAFLSDRESTGGPNEKRNQLYIMRPDGGEAQRVTEEKEGLDRYEFSHDGKWIAYTAGKPGQRQLVLIPATGGRATALVKRETGVNDWAWAPDSRSLYFTSPMSVDKYDRIRVEKKFDVRIHNEAQPTRQLWAVEVDGGKESQLTTATDFSVASFVIARDGKTVAFKGASADRYATGEESEIFLLDPSTKTLTRVTTNGVGEGQMVFSPNGQQLAFTAPEGFTFMRNNQIYVVAARGGQIREVVKNFDADAHGIFWSQDGNSIYFNSGVGVNQQVFMTPASGGNPTQVTGGDGAVAALRDDDQTTDSLLISFTDPYNPPELYATTTSDLANRSTWRKISDANPQIRDLELGQYETVHWKSSDGATVEGILVKPIGYREGQRYPLIVQIHGGPAGAYINSFSGNYGTYTHVYAAAGYAVFEPNYRGSSNYGEKFKTEIAGDYFRQGYDDIITGVDYLIARGIADPDKLGMMGWSAGGHWSNWTLTHTTRFKAISSGAGAVNWISMYAQTDVQVPREFYFKGRPYDNWDHYVEVSPLKYIKNAKTPTLIHVGEADQRVPMPQSLELHMALKKLGVPTELITYPGMPHGLTNPRYQFVKMASEFSWFEKWIKGKPGWLDWKTLVDTVTDDGSAEKEKAEPATGDGR